MNGELGRFFANTVHLVAIHPHSTLFHPFAPGGVLVRGIVIIMSVCYPSAHTTRKPHGRTPPIFVHTARGHDSVLL